MIRAAIVVFLMQAANYNQYISTLARAIPNEVGNALAAAGANAGSVASGAAFDTVWNAAAKAGLTAWEQVPKYSLSSIPLWFAIIVYLAIALVAIGVSFLVYLASTILLLLLLAVGPLFVALFAFPQTFKFASGWVAALVSAIVTQILALAVLAMFVATEQATIARITTDVAVNGNFIDAIITLAEAALLMWLIATLVKQTPSIAQGIAGGVYQNVSGIVDAPGKAAMAAWRLANRGGGPGRPGGGGGGNGGGPPPPDGDGGGSGTVSPPRVARPTGASLSGGQNVR
jgi:type IV secretion system protein VirB6